MLHQLHLIDSGSRDGVLAGSVIWQAGQAVQPEKGRGQTRRGSSSTAAREHMPTCTAHQGGTRSAAAPCPAACTGQRPRPRPATARCPPRAPTGGCLAGMPRWRAPPPAGAAAPAAGGRAGAGRPQTCSQSQRREQIRATDKRTFHHWPLQGLAEIRESNCVLWCCACCCARAQSISTPPLWLFGRPLAVQGRPALNCVVDAQCPFHFFDAGLFLLPEPPAACRAGAAQEQHAVARFDVGQVGWEG